MGKGRGTSEPLPFGYKKARIAPLTFKEQVTRPSPPLLKYCRVGRCHQRRFFFVAHLWNISTAEPSSANVVSQLPWQRSVGKNAFSDEVPRAAVGPTT